MDSTYIILIILGCAIALLLYLIPTFIAFTKSHPYKWIIFVINIFFGVSIIGWVIAFVWAVWPNKRTLLDPIGDPSGKGNVPDIGKRVGTLKKHSNQNQSIKELFEMKQQGIITEEEYQKMKRDLIY